jgi:hypothetical protein
MSTTELSAFHLQIVHNCHAHHAALRIPLLENELIRQILRRGNQLVDQVHDIIKCNFLGRFPPALEIWESLLRYKTVSTCRNIVPSYTHNKIGWLVGKLTKKDVDPLRDRISSCEIAKNPYI